jgi:PKD repeat protein
LTFVLALGILSASGCGPGTSASTTSTSTNSDPGFGTTHGPGITYAVPGTYTVNITGTSGNLSVTHVYSIYIADTYDVGVIP